MFLPKIVTEGKEPLFLPDTDERTFTRKILKVEVPDQEANNWCWAAVAVGISEAYEDSGLTQCEVATLLFKDEPVAPNCCLEEDKPACDKQMSLSKVLKIPGHDRLAADPLPKQTFQFIVDEIDAGRPIAVGIQRLNPEGQPVGGHFAVITGYLHVPGTENGAAQEFVYFDDPLARRGVRPLASFERRSDGEWKVTYKTKGTATKDRVPFSVEVVPEN